MSAKTFPGHPEKLIYEGDKYKEINFNSVKTKTKQKDNLQIKIELSKAEMYQLEYKIRKINFNSAKTF